MKHATVLACAAVFVFAGRSWAQSVVGTAFTYQGQLNESGVPVDGIADFQFSLWNEPIGSDPDYKIGDTLVFDGQSGNPSSIQVEDGLFTVELDFGASPFRSEAIWLQVAVRYPAGSGNYTTFLTRQRVAPAPIALGLPGWLPQQNDTSPNLLGGWENNSITEGVVGAVIAGGGSPLISGNQRPNKVTDNYGVVAGGSGNQAGDNDSTVDDADHATVGGGYANVASASNTTVGGGWYNRATYERATVAGGWNNLASGHASVVSGGRDNQATGSRATVPGGGSNVASGDSSFAAGNRAKAQHDGTFIWADSNASDFTSTGSNQFLIRAGGGVGIGTDEPRFQLDVWGGSIGLRIDGSGDPSTAGFLIDASEDHLHFYGGGKKLFEGGGLVGIGTTDPQSELHVSGTVTMDGFKLADAACAGCVLTSDATGEGTWQPPGGFALPYSGTASSSGYAFQLTNQSGNGLKATGTGTGIYGASSTSNSYGALGGSSYGVVGYNGSDYSYGYLGHDGCGVWGLGFNDGNGVYGESASGHGIHGSVNGSNGIGVYGVTSNTSSSETTYGVTGIHSDSGSVGRLAGRYFGVYGQSADYGVHGVSFTGQGVYGQAESGDGVYGLASSGKGVYGYTQTGYGVYAEASDQAGVALYAKSTGSGYAAVFDGAIQLTGGSDLSERFDIRSDKKQPSPKPGMVVCIDPDNPGGLKISAESCDRKVAGIISGAGGINTGMLMGQPGSIADGQMAVALTGRVYCFVDTGFGEIQPGDMLTTSPTPGHAMKVKDYSKAQGAIIGKAMTPLEEGRGLVLVLVNLQ